VESGRKDSPNLVKNISQITSGKNEGKSNETNHYTQALAEMESTIKKQLKKGYVENINDAKSSTVLGSGISAPMLAHKYCADGSQSSSKTLVQLKLTGKRIICQPKLDGNRCLIKIEDGEATAYTRKGDPMPVQLSHILDTLPKDEDIILDGELFSDEISFNTLNGLIKRVKATPEDIENRKKIKYHLYDAMSDKGYEFRKEMLWKFESESVLIVPSFEIIATDENIQNMLERFLAEGHEGLMIRQLGIGYENKRSWQLLKDKVFEDSEFLLIGFEEDVRGGFVGAFVMKDSKGNIFNAGSSGQSVEERTYMWNNQDEYLGNMATVCYFGVSEYGIPRFPKFKDVRN
jgi:ATP-dependent DNA ligase